MNRLTGEVRILSWEIVPEGEALRDDDNFASVFAWEFQGNGQIAPPKLHREPLDFETVHLTQRSYK